MTIYDLKPAFQNLLRPVTAFLANRKVTANQVTLAAAILSVLLGLFLTVTDNLSWFVLLPIFLFIRMALNAIDGMLAREHNMKSPLGAILNEVGDVISDIALYIPFAFLLGVSSGWVIVVLFLTLISEFVGVAAIQAGSSRRYDGPMGKSDRAFVFGVLGLIVGLGIEVSSWFDWVMMAISVLLLLTTFNRAKACLNEVDA